MCTPDPQLEALQRELDRRYLLPLRQAGMSVRVDLARVDALVDENTVLARELDAARQRTLRQAAEHTRRCEAQQREIVQLRAQLQHRDIEAVKTLESEAREPLAPQRLDDQAVLCVGGRPAAVPLYRHIVEKIGGRFMHHDGGEEESNARLEATLAAADLVICQTGCISHDAYWRVKNHCKRTGKRCVFVETPSTAGLKRALAELPPVPAS